MILPRIPIPAGAALVVGACLAVAIADGMQRAVTAIETFASRIDPGED